MTILPCHYQGTESYFLPSRPSKTLAIKDNGSCLPHLMHISSRRPATSELTVLESFKRNSIPVLVLTLVRWMKNRVTGACRSVGAQGTMTIITPGLYACSFLHTAVSPPFSFSSLFLPRAGPERDFLQFPTWSRSLQSDSVGRAMLFLGAWICRCCKSLLGQCTVGVITTTTISPLARTSTLMRQG